MVFSRYTVGSSAVTAAVVSYAWATREQFYPTVVYLVTSKLCVLALGNQVIVLTLLAGRSAKAVFLGSLREAEVELLHENARYAGHRDVLSIHGVPGRAHDARLRAVYGVVIRQGLPLARPRARGARRARAADFDLAALAVGCFNVLVGSCGFGRFRGLRGHVPEARSLRTCCCLDLNLRYSEPACARTRASTYSMPLSKGRYDGTWPPKAQYAFFVDFIAEVLRFAAYVVFFSIVFAYYGVPLHIVRELWASYVQLRQRLQAFQEVPSVNGEHGRKVSTRD